MTYVLHGALIEYGSDFLGPLPNVVVFQFNPESLSRSFTIPTRPTGATARETSQAGEIPVERFTVRALFSAADQLDQNNPLARAFGVGPQLAALAQMVHPTNLIGGLVSKAIDAIGSALGVGGDPPTQSIPREQYPRLLFVWGLSRVLPVIVESMTITEQQYDAFLNPVEAEVSIGLAVIDPYRCSDDTVAKGAAKFTKAAQEAMAIANLANVGSTARDLIPF